MPDSRVLAARALWSGPSRRSRPFQPGRAIHCRDQHYWCEMCGAACVFTAVERKHAFEVEKRYSHTTRRLCEHCRKAPAKRSPAAERATPQAEPSGGEPGPTPD